MKKLLVVLLTYLSISTALADNSNAFNGFFSRISLGAMEANIKDKNQLTIVTLDTQNPYNLIDSSHPTITDYALTGGLSLGYAQIFNSILMGIDARVNFESLKLDFDSSLNASGVATNWDNHTSVYLKNDFALLIKLGILCQANTLFYGVAGPSWGQFKTSHKANFLQIGSGADGVFTGNIHDNNTAYETGLTLGLGIEHMLTKQLSLGIEYDYTDYGTLNSPNDLSAFILQNGAIVNGQTIAIADEMQAKTNRVTLNLVYYFDIPKAF